MLPVRWCVLIALSAGAQAQSPVQLFPVDDTFRDSDFGAYVIRLRVAVAARDLGSLRKLVDKDVVCGPNEKDKGWDKFVARWRFEHRQASPGWEALSALLSLGFVREHPGLFLSPYVAWRFPESLNPATHLVVIRDNAALRASPSGSAGVVASLSFDVVRRLGPSVGGDNVVQWVPVQTLDGRKGYVNSRDLMSPLLPRAQFGRSRGKWLLLGLEGPPVN